MTRYFIGLMVPPPVQTHLTALAETIQAALPADHPYHVSWNHPADLHCTVLFIGNHDDEAHLVDSMIAVATQLPSSTLTVAGTTHWLGRNSLAAQVTGADQLGTTFVERLGGLSSDRWAGRRPFHGHVTIGRVRPVPRAANDFFSGHEVEPLTWQATHVQLVQGYTGPGGRRYRVVAEAPFEGPGPDN